MSDKIGVDLDVDIEDQNWLIGQMHGRFSFLSRRL